ncbi:MAG TPA: HIT domain-containing protein [Bryobacteraceae bacterium]|nr:HIT domain-containing protein [Bryobacteraceae bacterium]
MDYLWTPWRYQYISSAKPSEGCIFCTKPAESDDEKSLIVHRASHNFVILNFFPYNSGHLMVVPYEHVATLEDASPETAAELFSLTRHCEALLRRVYRAEGINLGMNIGTCAGAGIAGHIHMHLVPRWTGDANFMSTLAETRVLPEELHVTWQRLRDAWDTI